jgi:hypothetical protein
LISAIARPVVPPCGCGGTNWIAFQGAHLQVTWDLLLYLVSPEAMASYAEVANSVPTRSDDRVKWQLHPELAPFFTEQAQECPESVNEAINPFGGKRLPGKADARSEHVRQRPTVGRGDSGRHGPNCGRCHETILLFRRIAYMG